VTGPIQRLCRLLASEGYIAVSPEVYHEFETPGHILKYDAEDTDKGNKYKVHTVLLCCACRYSVLAC
jgi:carboxymethylenebutenolidase